MSQILKITNIGQETLKQFFSHLGKHGFFERLQMQINPETQELNQQKHQSIKNILTLLSEIKEIEIAINENGYRTMSPPDFYKISSIIESPKTERLFKILCGGFNIPEVANEHGVSRQALHEQYINFLNYAYAFNKTSRWLRDLPTPFP